MENVGSEITKEEEFGWELYTAISLARAELSNWKVDDIDNKLYLYIFCV